MVVRAPSRLHFGLIGWGAAARRQFGGLGLMIDDPGLALELGPSESWVASGPLAPRATETVRRLAERLGLSSPRNVLIRRAPSEHIGLGVGTSLTLAIAAALLAESGDSAALDVDRLATLTGRARRSGVGLHGFVNGGLIIDGGHGPASGRPPLVGRHELPESWHVLVATPRPTRPIHGDLERQAFAALEDVPLERSDRIAGLILLGVIPALLERDLDAFGRALTEIQRLVGLSFSGAQRGVFADPTVEALVGRLEDLGLRGVGQSSWGPTVFGFSEADAAQRETIRRRLVDEWGDRLSDVFWTRASRGGATIRHD